MTAKMISRLGGLAGLLLVAGVVIGHAATGGCTAATLRGAYAMLEQGSVVAPPPGFPAVLVGIATYDGAGMAKN